MGDLGQQSCRTPGSHREEVPRTSGTVGSLRIDAVCLDESGPAGELLRLACGYPTLGLTARDGICYNAACRVTMKRQYKFSQAT